MKLFYTAILLAFFQPTYAEDKVESIQNDKLKILASTHDGKPIDKPENWLRFYQLKEPSVENRIYITAEFDVPDVKAIIIKDVNALNKKCGPKHMETFLYLAFDPTNNLKKITTRIHKPCFVERKAVFELLVKTSDGKRYHNITTLTANPNAFLPVFKYSRE